MAKSISCRWLPLTVEEAATLLSGLEAPWWIAGGYAIELFAGRAIREHGDLDVVVLRRDQHQIQELLHGWDLRIAYLGELLAWPDSQRLEPPHSDVWCRESSDSPWRLQMMLLDTEGEDWVFKRNRSIRGALSELGSVSSDGVPFLRPEIQLLYKARAETLEKDQLDFDAVLPLLDERARRWLRDCLRVQFPGGHGWLSALAV
ncbi:MAG: nucleotidyltransferase domain-containing protein [Phycisphaerales bacterium]